MMTKIGQWLHWVIFRLSVVPIIWLVALVIGLPLSLLLLKDTNVINQSSDSLALTFTGLIVGVLLAHITQVIHEVISHHSRYPPSIPPSSSHQGGPMTGNDETENQVHTNTDPNKEVRDRCTTGGGGGNAMPLLLSPCFYWQWGFLSWDILRFAM